MDKQDLILQKKRNAINYILRDKDAAMYLCQIIRNSGVFADCFSNETSVTNFMLGKRSIGLKIYNDIVGVNKNYVSKLFEIEEESKNVGRD